MNEYKLELVVTDAYGRTFFDTTQCTAHNEQTAFLAVTKKLIDLGYKVQHISVFSIVRKTFSVN